MSRDLSPAHAAILDAMLATPGEFVKGKVLAEAGGIEIKKLWSWVRHLKTARPDYQFEGSAGHGYRAWPACSARPAPPTPVDRSYKRFSDTLVLVDLLPTRAAEIVKPIALESGERVEETIERLLVYGGAVHRDLVAAGENPLGLRRLAS